ncbi:hypothetical protein [Stenotrophomonas sp. YIM B06876]|uniref:hypothetical protein n=1 Tax=Stenotrophomonas sp. YIM B06876 TaxID=3060211 RepID=UPI0027395683|nr:hypothetical protein [Stenotrophomonas sp. YIM B06876]
MIRDRVVKSLRELASSIGSKAEGTQWHLFGSVDRDAEDAADIDLLVLCISDGQADTLRQAIDPDALELPLHLAFMTFEEAAAIDATGVQQSRVIFP